MGVPPGKSILFVYQDTAVSLLLQRWAGRYVLLKERVGPRSKRQPPFDNVALRVLCALQGGLWTRVARQLA
jgi:hypothetical protein